MYRLGMRTKARVRQQQGLRLGRQPLAISRRPFSPWLRAGVAPNVLTYTTLMSACSRHGQWERALQAFHHMEAAGLQPDVLAYNSAITAYARAGAWEKAWALFGSERNLAASL
jgi:pentatricopeptide repeat protein